jgi:DNA-binding MarR family transcriptional regulator
MADSSESLPATSPAGTTPAVVAWLRMLRLHRKVQRVLEASCQANGLSLAQFDVLAHVGAAEGMTQQELADKLLVTKGNVCQLLDRMEASGVLCRRQQGRANRLYLTDSGRDLYRSVVPTHEQLITEMFSVLSQDDESCLLDALRILDRSLK